MFSNNESATVVPFPGSRGRRAPRERILEAMLVVSGEMGYEQVAVRHVIERAQTSRATFYKHFEDREDCFAQAYGDASEWLYRRLIGAAKRRPTWREGLRASLAELLEFCANQPAIAKAIFVEVHAAGAEALARRAEAMKRAADFIDLARLDAGESETPPQIAPEGIVAGIHAIVHSRLSTGATDGFRGLLPEFMYFAVLPYFGADAAAAEMQAARA